MVRCSFPTWLLYLPLPAMSDPRMSLELADNHQVKAPWFVGGDKVEMLSRAHPLGGTREENLNKATHFLLTGNGDAAMMQRTIRG